MEENFLTLAQLNKKRLWFKFFSIAFGQVMCYTVPNISAHFAHMQLYDLLLVFTSIMEKERERWTKIAT